MRRFALALAALALGASLASGEDVAVVVDRSANLRWADPRGEGRLAVAFALGLATKPTDSVAVFAPGLDPPVAASGASLESLAPALKTIALPPRAAGGVELLASMRGAAEKRGRVIAYTADEVDVVGETGEVPEAPLARAREKGRPDRRAVNEAARSLLLEGAEGVKGRLFALRAPLPEAARGVPFLEALGARVVDLDGALSAARKLAQELGARDPGEPVPVALGVVAARPGTRVALLASKKVSVEGTAIALDDGRAWLVDADGGFRVAGEDGTEVHALMGARPALELAIVAVRLAGEAGVHLEVRSPAALTVRSGEADLPRGADGVHRGRVAAGRDQGTVRVTAALEGGAPFVLDAAVVRAPLRVEGSPGAAGEPFVLTARAEKLPAFLVPAVLGLELSCEGASERVELARDGDGFKGEVRLSRPGTWTLGRSLAGDLEVEVAPLEVGPAPALQASLASPGPVPVRDGAASFEVDLALAPPREATLAAGKAKVEPAKLSGKGRVTISMAGLELADPTTANVEVRARLDSGFEAVATVPVELVPQRGLLRFVIAGLAILAAAVWGGVVARNRAIERRFGDRQLRGIGSNGRLSYERYRLRDHRVAARAAVVPPGAATSVRLEVDREGRVTAVALEGSHLLGVEARPKPSPSLPLVHETAFVVARGLYARRYVYLEREPNGDELTKRYGPEGGAPPPSASDAGDAVESDVIVLLDEKQNMVPPSARLVPIESARLPQVNDIVGAESSDEDVIVADSEEERVLDEEGSVLDAGSDDSTLGSSSSDLDSKEP